MNTSPDIVEDACAFAWVQFMRYQPSRERAWRAWLITTAEREAWRLHGIEAGHKPFEAATVEGRKFPDEPRDPRPDRAEQHAEALEALSVLSTVSERRRRAKELHVAGLTYEEIARELGLGLTRVKRVAASNASGSSSAASEASAVVTASAPENVLEPTTNGARLLGAEIVSSPGEWSGSAPASFEHQWQQCADETSECVNIAGATGSSYVIAPGDRGSLIRLVVTATNAHGSTVAHAPPTSVPPPVPENIAPPVVSGTPRVGQTLTTTSGTWSGPAELYRRQWQRCDDAQQCTDIPGAISLTYVVAARDAGRTIRVGLRASSGGEDSSAALSAQTAVVGTAANPTGSPRLEAAPALPTTIRNGDALLADRGGWSGQQPMSYSYRWERCQTRFGSCSFASTNPELTVGRSDVGTWLRIRVTASNSIGMSSAFSDIKGPIINAPPDTPPSPPITGDAVIGGLLSASLGSWQPRGALTVQWLRCSATGTECTEIDGAEEATSYLPGRDDLGHALRIRLTDENELGWAESMSAVSPVVEEATIPSADDVPTIAGEARAGEQLTAGGVEWSGSPEINVDHAWSRCEASGASCVSIEPADGTEYVARRADVGSRLRVTTTASNGAGATSITSEPTDIVGLPAPLANVSAPSIDWWEAARYGDRLRASPGQWTGEPDVSVQWQRCDPLTVDLETGEMDCDDIAGATDPEGDHTPIAADIGFRLRLKVIASTPEESQTLYSEPTTGTVDMGEGHYTTQELVGIPVAGQPISADIVFDVDPELPLTTSYEFRRDLAEGPDIVLQTGSDRTYTLTGDDEGHAIVVTTTTTIWRADQATSVASVMSIVETPVIEPAPTNDFPPSIGGEPTAGAVLTAVPGDWSGGGGPLEYGYQWQRCDADGEGCVDIEGATGETHRPAAGLTGSTLRVRVTAANGPVSATAISGETDQIVAATAPVNLEQPSVSGIAAERETLTGDIGAWNGTQPLDYAYQWQSCQPDGTACEDIADATEETFTPGPAELGLVLRLAVTADNTAGSPTVVSEATAPIEAGPPPESTEAPSLAILGRPTAGATATTDGGAWQNVDESELDYQWQRCDDSGDNCTDVGNGSPHHQLTDEDAEARIRVQVTATTNAGVATATSVLSPKIGAATPAAVEKMVYLSGDRTRLFLANGDGENPQLLISCATLSQSSDPDCRLYRPVISPNGQMIAVHVRTGTDANPIDSVAVMNYDASDARVLTTGRDPAWSADGTEILFTETDGAETRIASVRADGTDVGISRQLVSAAGSEESPDVAPDGTKLAFTARASADSESELYVAAADGASPELIDLPAAIRDAHHPRFTADATQILFEATPPDAAPLLHDVRQAWLVNPDGSGLRQLTHDDGSATNENPTSGQDGRILVTRRTVETTVFSGGGASIDYGEYRTWIIDPDGDLEPGPGSGAGESRADASGHRASTAQVGVIAGDCVVVIPSSLFSLGWTFTDGIWSPGGRIGASTWIKCAIWAPTYAVPRLVAWGPISGRVCIERSSVNVGCDPYVNPAPIVKTELDAKRGMTVFSVTFPRLGYAACHRALYGTGTYRIAARITTKVIIDTKGAETPIRPTINTVSKGPYEREYCPTELDGWERLKHTSAAKPWLKRASPPQALLGTALGNRGNRDTRPVDENDERFGWEAHHIIPAGDRRARTARTLGFRCHIHPNSKTNGVWLRGDRRRYGTSGFQALDVADKIRVEHWRTFSRDYMNRMNSLMNRMKIGTAGCDYERAAQALSGPNGAADQLSKGSTAVDDVTQP